MKKACKGIIVGYGRKSKEDKDVKGASLENQKARCSEYARSKGYDFVYFEDNNKTGDNLNRPGFKAMVEFLKKNKVKKIVVWQLDRMTRNIEDYYGVIQPLLRKCNTTIASINQSFEDVLQLDPLILAMYVGMAAQELKNIKERTKSVIEHRAKNGYALGKAPVGYNNTRDKDKRGVITLNLIEAPYVKRGFELAALGTYSEERIGIELAKFGLVTSAGKPFPKKRISDMLNNPLYMGKISYNGELYDGRHEPIVSEELFYRVQLMLRDKRKLKSHNENFVYTNYIKCALCGYSMIGHLRHGAHNSNDYIYYRCSNYGKMHKTEKNIRQEVIDEAMQEVIESFDISEVELKKVKKQVFKALDELQAYELKSIEELKKQYSNLVNAITLTIQGKGLDGKFLDLDTDTRREVLNNLQAQKSEVNSKIMYLTETSKETVTKMSILLDFANRLPELYLKATPEEKRLILVTITDSITMNAYTNQITVKLKPVFEHLRQLKSQKKQPFIADIKTLDGTLETRSESAKQACKNKHSDLNDFKVYGTLKKVANTRIESHKEGSKKLNVGGGT